MFFNDILYYILEEIQIVKIEDLESSVTITNLMTYYSL